LDAELELAPSVQLGLLKLPLPSLLKLTVPPGALGVPWSLSVTTAVQVVWFCTTIVPGTQVTEIEVWRWS
jgi:hypothetical protein